jgi:hypothetical protein
MLSGILNYSPAYFPELTFCGGCRAGATTNKEYLLIRKFEIHVRPGSWMYPYGYFAKPV